MLTEIRKLTTWPAVAISIEEASKPDAMLAAIPLCRPTKAKMVRAVLPAGTELVPLQIRSAHKWLDPELPRLKGKLVAVVSSWVDFREIARTMLAAAGVDPDLLVVRNPKRPRWGGDWIRPVRLSAMRTQRLRAQFPKETRVFVFSLLADAFQLELSKFSDSSQFL